MFTQVGLSNLWKEVKGGKWSFSSDIQIVCDSVHERCLKIYSLQERRYAYYSSKRSLDRSEDEPSIWVRSVTWNPEDIYYGLYDEFFVENQKSSIRQVQRLAV
jgi:hypothetical protein